jgi:hypothetical protein
MVTEQSSNPLSFQDSLSSDVFNLKNSNGLEIDSYRSTSSFQPALSSNTLNLNIPTSTSGFNQSPFTSGTFKVGSTGQVGIDYLFDGGGYEGEVAIFSLEGLESLGFGTPEFIQEITRRALSNSMLGYVVVSDQIEGARFSSEFPWEGNSNAGEYLDVKTFSMRPDDTFGVMLVPNGTVQQVYGNPTTEGALRPLFSMVSANPHNTFQFGQIADVDGKGSTFVMEDLRLDGRSDRDYNDIIFQVRGAIGSAVNVDNVIDPNKDWRNQAIGQTLLSYIASYENPTTQRIDYRFPLANQPLIGIIDTGSAANNPDIDYSRIILGHDYVDGDSNPLLAPGEGNEHGTHILGIIGATQNNGIGIDGINDQAPIWLGRAIGSGQWAVSLIDFVNQIRASGQPNGVVNLSLDLTQKNPDGSITTRYEFTPQERQALEYARQNGVLVVVAAGNEGGTMSALGQASQEFDNIITVGSVDSLGRRAVYSNFGNGLDLVAYGGTMDKPVLSTVGNGADLKFLIEGLDALGGETASFIQSIFDEISANLFDIDTDFTSSVALSNGSTNLWEQAYDETWDEISAILADDTDLLDADLSDKEEALLQSQVDLENLLAEFSSFLDALDPDFLDFLNDPEVADLFALLEDPDAMAEEELDLGVGEMAGTSVATAMVTGTISQVWAANPNLSYAQVKDILKRTAVDLGEPGWDAETGAGLVNLAAAVNLAKQTTPEQYYPEAFAIPTTWSGQDTVIPTERAAADEFMGRYYEWDTYTIRSGDTLSAIALRAMGNGSTPYYNFIASKNNIPNPNLIYAGRTILIPRQVDAPQPQPQPQPGYSVQGGIRQRWLQNPWLGEPRSNEIGQGNGVVIQYFANGYIIWNGRRATVYRNTSSTPYDGLRTVKPTYGRLKAINKTFQAAQFIRRLVSPRGFAKIRDTLRFAKPSFLRNAKLFAYPIARRLLLKNPLGKVVTNFARFATTPSFVKTVAKFSKPLRVFGRFIPYVDLAVTTLDVGLDFATAQTEEQKKRANVKAIAGGVGFVVGGIIGGVLGAGAGGVGAVPGAVGGAGLGASLATTAVDAYYWASDNKDKISNFFSGAGNKFKSVFGF